MNKLYIFSKFMFFINNSKIQTSKNSLNTKENIVIKIYNTKKKKFIYFFFWYE